MIMFDKRGVQRMWLQDLGTLDHLRRRQSQEQVITLREQVRADTLATFGQSFR